MHIVTLAVLRAVPGAFACRAALEVTVAFLDAVAFLGAVTCVAAVAAAFVAVVAAGDAPVFTVAFAVAIPIHLHRERGEE